MTAADSAFGLSSIATAVRVWHSNSAHAGMYKIELSPTQMQVYTSPYKIIFHIITFYSSCNGCMQTSHASISIRHIYRST